jgi:hypothetical protein
LLSSHTSQAQQGLQVEFGTAGLKKLSWHGQTLEDLQRWPDDAFHIGHMKAFDTAGHPLPSGQYGWGENHDSRNWDAASKTWTYHFSWGSIRVQYRQQGDSLSVIVTESNRSGSNIVFDGASVYPLVLHMPRVPVGFGERGDSHIIANLDQPSVLAADFGAGEAVLSSTDDAKPLYTGFQAMGKDFAYAPVISGTSPDGLRGHGRGRLLRPGESESFSASLRFVAAATPPSEAAPDAYKAFARRWPETLHWTDRRIIGTVFLASSAEGDKTHSAGFPNNPRRYFTDPTVDVKTPEGLKHFQARILKQAADIVENLKRLHAQGTITWDIEGEEFPQDTSYACTPDQVATLSPEMESKVSDEGSPYRGMKLDDAYFKIIHDAEFRVGVCVRPQQFTFAPDGSARQVTLPDDEVAGELIRKMKYAHDRWGATIFYLDSTVEGDGSTLPASILEQAAASLPDSLLIPEESTPRMYRATAPFRTFLFHGDLGTPADIRALYPQAFSANLINDVDPAKLEAHRLALTDSVRHGDVLMDLAGYWQANNPIVVEIYRAAAASAGK